jgi:hypothetical protein
MEWKKKILLQILKIEKNSKFLKKNILKIIKKNKKIFKIIIIYDLKN